MINPSLPVMASAILPAPSGALAAWLSPPPCGFFILLVGFMPANLTPSR
jgi:hypothetical protein